MSPPSCSTALALGPSLPTTKIVEYKHFGSRKHFVFLSYHSLGNRLESRLLRQLTVPTTSAKMKLTLLLLSAAAAVVAQTLDTVSATASGACEPHNDHWYTTLTETFPG
jgi:hypothetical protein